MPSLKNVFLDVGDLYTKLFVLGEDNNLEYDICFPTIAKRETVWEKTCGSYKEFESEGYKLVGWDAAYKSTYEDVVEIRSKASIFDILNKILFDYFKDQSSVNINFIVDEDDELIQIENLGKLYKGLGFHIDGHMNGVQLTKQYRLNIKSHSVSGILKKYFFSPSADEGQKVAIVIDIGFKKTKCLLLDMKNNNAVCHKLYHGFDYYLIKLKEYFADVDITLHPFILLKELERSNNIIDTGNGKYDISNIIENVRFDLCKILVNEIELILKNYYNSYLLWPDFLYITGGGAILNGNAIKAGLTSRYDHFKQTLIEPRPRNYLIRKYLGII
jgi:hypothetical protein